MCEIINLQGIVGGLLFPAGGIPRDRGCWSDFVTGLRLSRTMPIHCMTSTRAIF